MGWEPLGRGACQAGGFIGECLGASGASHSKVDGQFQNWVPQASIWLARLKEGKKSDIHQHFCSQRKFLQISDPLTYALKLVNKPFKYYLGTSQTAPSRLGLRLSDIVCWLFQSTGSISYRSLALLELKPPEV